MNASDPIHAALQDFAAAVTAKMTQVTAGEPEDQVRGPFETFMEAAARAFGWEVVCTGETPLPDRLGRPDYWEPTIPISRNGKIDLLPGSGPLPNGRLGRRSASTPARRSTLGRLDDLATVTTSMRVAAFVYGIAGPRSLRSGADVEEAFWYPLGDLLDPHGRRCGSSSTAAPGTAGRASTCGRPAVPSCGG